MHRNRGETRKGKLGRSCTKWMDTSREGMIPYCGINKRKPTEPSLTVNCTSQQVMVEKGNMQGNRRCISGDRNVTKIVKQKTVQQKNGGCDMWYLKKQN